MKKLLLIMAMLFLLVIWNLMRVNSDMTKEQETGNIVETSVTYLDKPLTVNVDMEKGGAVMWYNGKKYEARTTVEHLKDGGTITTTGGFYEVEPQ